MMSNIVELQSYVSATQSYLDELDDTKSLFDISLGNVVADMASSGSSYRKDKANDLEPEIAEPLNRSAPPISTDGDSGEEKEVKPANVTPSTNLEFSDSDSGADIVKRLTGMDIINLDRDKIDGADPHSPDATVKPLEEELIRQLDNNPEFREAFLEGIQNGVRYNFRYNADDSHSDLINLNVLQIDISADGGIENALKDTFNADSSWDVKEPGAGPSLKEVLADDKMSGEDFVANLERLGTFSFTGPSGAKMRKDVVYLYDKSPYMKEVMRDTLEETPNRKFNFSSIGEGGGTISTPFTDFATTVNANGGYTGSDEDYNSADHLGQVSVIAHEMNHSFLSVGDKPIIDVAGAIISNELRNTDNSSEGTGDGDIAYDDNFEGDHVTIGPDFDRDKFFELVNNPNADALSLEQIMEQVNGVGTVDGD